MITTEEQAVEIKETKQPNENKEKADKTKEADKPEIKNYSSDKKDESKAEETENDKELDELVEIIKEAKANQPEDRRER